MNFYRNVSKNAAARRQSLFSIGLAVALGLGGASLILTPPASATTNLFIWDTGARFSDALTRKNEATWKIVPSELFVYEKEPIKAASDPGYYGREYSFKGDPIVQNRRVTAVFWSNQGRVVLYANGDAAAGEGWENRPFGREILSFAPFASKKEPGRISRCEIRRNGADEVIIQAFFGAKETPETAAVFTFGRTELVEIKPSPKMKTVNLQSAIAYGVLPTFVGDDLIFAPADYPMADTLHLTADNIFVGLLQGEESEFVMTWPSGQQRLRLTLADASAEKRVITGVEFDPDGQSIYLASLSAPGLWHREELKPTYLEKDVALEWKRPFPARWKTQLSEADVKTTFAFRDYKGQVWRGVPGSYQYPAWFEGETAHFSLSKKVPPKGEAIIYFLEGQDTPLAVSTPVDFLKATLGRQMSDSILDPTGRKLRTHHRRGGDGVHRACTCGCTEAIQAIFEAGQEVTKKDHVKEALADMRFFVECHVNRIQEYSHFAGEMIQFLQAKGTATPELKMYLDNLQQIIQQIPQEYDVQKENMKTPEHVTELTLKTMSLTGSKSTNNLPAYMELLKAWRAMGGAQDYVVANCHMVTRKLFQEAGYSAVNDPKAIAVAQEIRARCRQALRNPDGYEIWADY